MLKITIPFSSQVFWEEMDYVVYVALEMLYKTSNFSKSYTSAELLSAQLYGDKDKAHVDLISETLKRFKKAGLIKRELNMYSFETSIFELNSNFLTLDADLVVKVLEHKKWHLIRHMVILKSTFDYNIEVDGNTGIIGHMPISYLAYLSGTSEQTISKNNSDLEKLGVLYIIRNKFENGNRIPNICCFSKDKKFLHQFLSKNDNQSIHAKYYKYINSKKRNYTPDQVKELYNMCLEYNKVNINSPFDLTKLSL